MAAYPGALAAFAGFTATHTLAADNHAAQHNLEQAEILAVQAKVGTGASTPTANKVLAGNGLGTSNWSQVNLTTMVSEVLPIANGGTGQNNLTGLTLPSAILATPAISNPAITGGGSWTGSPTISTPTIASFANSVHNHQNAAGGGKLSIISAITFSGAKLTKSVDQLFSSGVGANATWNTEVYDTDSYHDNVTNNSRLTAPVAGYYIVTANIGFSAGWGGTNARLLISFYKNGIFLSELFDSGLSVSNEPSVSVSDEVQLAAGDYLEVNINQLTGGNQNLNLSSTFSMALLGT